MSRSCAATLAVVLLLSGSGCPAVAQECPAGALTLEARAVQALPVTFGIEGVTAGPDGTLALWSAEGEILTISAPGTLERRGLPDHIRPAGVAVTSAGYRLVDRLSGLEYILGVDSAPAVTTRIPFPSTETLDQALWDDGEWVLGLRDAASREFRVRRGDRLIYRSVPADSPRTIPRYRLTLAGQRLLLSGVTAPFELIQLGREGRADTLSAALPAEVAALIPVDSLSRWRALSAIAIDCGVLVTLSDLTADRRLLIRYSASGHLDKVTALDAPLGLMTRLPGANAVLAARRAGTLELVWYDWRWIRDHQHSN